MALKPSSLRMLEDEFVCQCTYPDDTSYVAYLETTLAPRWVKDRWLDASKASPEKDKRKASA